MSHRGRGKVDFFLSPVACFIFIRSEEAAGGRFCRYPGQGKLSVEENVTGSYWQMSGQVERSAVLCA